MEEKKTTAEAEDGEIALFFNGIGHKLKCEEFPDLFFFPQ